MKKPTIKLEEQALKELEKRLTKIKSGLPGAKVAAGSHVTVKVVKSQARFKRTRQPDGNDTGHGEFFLMLEVTAPLVDVYLPLSIASGKKPVGFIYHIEGTGEGSIYTTDISCSGEGVTKITLGTIVYAKIPATKTARFRISVKVMGKFSKEYRVVINRINYKLDPQDARYQRYEEDISSETVKFL